MNRQFLSANKLGMFTVLLLLLAGASATYAQKPCAAQLEQAKQVIQKQDEVIEELNAKLNDKQRVVDLQDKQIMKQREIIDTQQGRIDNLNSKIEELQKQITTLEQNVRLSQENVQSQKTITELINALVQTKKRSALEKAVEALPSIAGIIALAITNK